MTKRILGIDPGASGAMALLDGDVLVRVADMPIIMVKGRSRILAPGVVDLIVETKPDQIVLEDVSAMPGQGVSSMFSFGRGLGVLEGVIAALGYPLIMVRPNRWKRDAGVPADKDAARAQRIKFVDAHTDVDVTIFAAHFGGPTAGKIVSEKGGKRWFKTLVT